MTAQSLPSPNFNSAFVDGRGFLTRWAAAWISGADSRLGRRADKVDAAGVMAAAAVPRTTQVVAGGGLQVGGALNGNVALALYRVKTTVALLPASGNSEGDWAYALDGRKGGEGAGAGTGTPCFWSTPAGVGGWFTPGGVVVAA
jgi:hypothetical protein